MQITLKYIRIVLLNSLLIIIEKTLGVWVAIALLHGRINAKNVNFGGQIWEKVGSGGTCPPKFKTEYRFLRYGICETNVFGFQKFLQEV